LHLLLGRRIGDANLEQEPVELGLRKRIRTFKFDGVLRGEHGEVFRQRIADAVNGYLALLHGLEQGGLCARRSAVDFVHQQQVREDGPAMQGKRAVAEVEDVCTGDVGGHEIGSTLHALKSETTNARQGFNCQCLGETGNPFDDRVAARDENEEELIDDFALPDDHFRKFTANLRCECGKVLHG
jgi:hypothetical protein